MWRSGSNLKMTAAHIKKSQIQLDAVWLPFSVWPEWSKFQGQLHASGICFARNIDVEYRRRGFCIRRYDDVSRLIIRDNREVSIVPCLIRKMLRPCVPKECESRVYKVQKLPVALRITTMMWSNQDVNVRNVGFMSGENVLPRCIVGITRKENLPTSRHVENDIGAVVIILRFTSGRDECRVGASMWRPSPPFWEFSPLL